jgi:dipeptidyl aminopeptidase/acylaminoacyl peptidase
MTTMTARCALPFALALVAAPLVATPPEPPTLETYGELPRVEDAALSPDGQRFASVLVRAGERFVLATDAEGKALVTGSAGTTKVRGIQWADNDTILITNSSTISLGFGFTADKYEAAGTIILPLGEGETGLVFSRDRTIANMTRGSYGIRTVAGRTIGFFGGIALSRGFGGNSFVHGRTTLFAVDLATNRATVAARAAGEDHYRDWLVDANGQVSVTLDVNERNGQWNIENARGDRLVSGVQSLAAISLVCFGKNGDTVIYGLEDEEGNWRRFEVPLSGGTSVEILAEEDIERLYIDRRSGNLIGYRTGGTDGRAVMYDPAQETALAKIDRAFAGREMTLVDWTPDFDRALLHTSGNGDSGTWFFVDVRALRADPVANDHDAIVPEMVGPISVVDYAAADGLEMDGILTLPPGREPRNLPVVVLPHGGPASEDKPVFDWWAQAFASRGYAVFQPNFRGSTGRGAWFREAGNGQWGRKMQTDISDGLAELVKQGLVDPGRACIVGASYGGYAALAGVTLQQGLYRCAVSVGGVADLKLMYNTDYRESGDSLLVSRMLQAQLGDPSMYDEVSPRRFARQADAPILLIHGKDDTVVHFGQSAAMADALKDAGKPYELVTLKGEDHWLSREETRKQMLEAAVGFVQKHNPAD